MPKAAADKRANLDALADEKTGRLDRLVLLERLRVPKTVTIVGSELRYEWPVHAGIVGTASARVPPNLLERFLRLDSDGKIAKFASSFGPLFADLDPSHWQKRWIGGAEPLEQWRSFRWEFNAVLAAAVAVREGIPPVSSPADGFTERGITVHQWGFKDLEIGRPPSWRERSKGEQLHLSASLVFQRTQALVALSGLSPTVLPKPDAAPTRFEFVFRSKQPRADAIRSSHCPSSGKCHRNRICGVLRLRECVRAKTKASHWQTQVLPDVRAHGGGAGREGRLSSEEARRTTRKRGSRMRAHRRGRGEGSIVQRADGRWMGRVDLGWRDGKRRSKATYGKTRREVSNKLRDLTREAQRGTLIEDERETVERFLRRWLADVARVRVRPRTLATYEAAIERHLIPHIGRVPLSKLSPQHLQAWLRHLEESGVSAQRRRYARVVLRIALNTAMRWNLVVRNAATLVDAPRVTPREFGRSVPTSRATFYRRSSIIRSRRCSRSAWPAGCGPGRL